MKRFLLLVVAMVATCLVSACAQGQTSPLEIKAFDYRVSKTFGSPDTYVFATVGPQHSTTLWSPDKSFSFQADYGPIAGSNLVGGAPAVGYSAGAYFRYDDATFFAFAGLSAYGLFEQGRPFSGTAGLTAGFGWKT